MTRRGWLAGLAGAGVLALSPAALLAQMFEKITIANSTGYTISEIYIAPSKARTWQEDVMALDVLRDGTEVDIDFRRSENTCDWDLRVVYSDGEEAIWQGLDLCTDWHFELFYNARTGDTRLVSSH